MSLLERARRKREVVAAESSALDQMHHDRDRNQHLGYIHRVLELDEGTLAAEDLTPVGRLRWEDNLWQFDLEGHHFIVGSYWHGNPGRGVVLAVQVAKRRRGEPEWPPPHPRSARNTGWAPAGYVKVSALWQLAAALDGKRP